MKCGIEPANQPTTLSFVKLIVAQLMKKQITFMKFEDSLPFFQDPYPWAA
jgi:hypothetical protein